MICVIRPTRLCYLTCLYIFFHCWRFLCISICVGTPPASPQLILQNMETVHLLEYFFNFYSVFNSYSKNVSFEHFKHLFQGFRGGILGNRSHLSVTPESPTGCLLLSHSCILIAQETFFFPKTCPFLCQQASQLHTGWSIRAASTAR